MADDAPRPLTEKCGEPIVEDRICVRLAGHEGRHNDVDVRLLDAARAPRSDDALRTALTRHHWSTSTGDCGCGEQFDFHAQWVDHIVALTPRDTPEEPRDDDGPGPDEAVWKDQPRSRWEEPHA